MQMNTTLVQLPIMYHAAAVAKSLQSCPTLCDPTDGSPPGSPVPGILQATHWSGLPFPSPMHESEKWKWSRSVVSSSSQPHVLQPTRLLHPWDFPGKSTGVGCHCLLHKDWLNGYKNKTAIYAVFKRPSSNQGIHTDWKWGAGKIYFMQMETKRKQE